MGVDKLNVDKLNVDKFIEESEAAFALLSDDARRYIRVSSGTKPKTVWPHFKEGSHLTCRHGRFWRSCPRCRYEKI